MQFEGVGVGMRWDEGIGWRAYRVCGIGVAGSAILLWILSNRGIRRRQQMIDW